jgi:predicted nucleotidyltransferase
MDEALLQQVKDIFAAHPEVKLAYFFGSRSKGEGGPTSDYDFAFFADTKDKKAVFELKLLLQASLSRVLQTDNVDVVALNLAKSPELKYSIIADGTLIYEEEPFRVIVEPRIMNEYFDFHELLLRHQLTRA